MKIQIVSGFVGAGKILADIPTIVHMWEDDGRLSRSGKDSSARRV